MRIISQDGTTDVPYEHVAVIRLNKKIYFFNSNLITDSQALAEYSAEAKAIKAMEMLREAYVGMPIVMQNVAISEDAAKEFEGLKKCGVMVQIENQPSKVDFINNAVFQFPKDDEVEV